MGLASKEELTTAIKDWALENGCRYMAHMYSPLRGSDGRVQPGYKMDSLLDIDYSSVSFFSVLIIFQKAKKTLSVHII
jgi:glutamine synthetase type III